MEICRSVFVLPKPVQRKRPHILLRPGLTLIYFNAYYRHSISNVIDMIFLILDTFSHVPSTAGIERRV